jgi:hypothetical protein
MSSMFRVRLYFVLPVVGSMQQAWYSRPTEVLHIENE